MSNDLDYFKLMRSFWDWAFENPEIIKPNHCALYAFSVEHCNRLGWKPKFGLPTEMAKEAIGIRSYHTYIKTLNDLVDFGFISMVERSKNQHSSNIVALMDFNKALDKALDKAFIKHASKQSAKQDQGECKSNDSIDKQDTTKQDTNDLKHEDKEIYSFDQFWDDYDNKKGKEKALKAWKKITEKEKVKIKETVKAFKQHKPFETYNHPIPSTYLNDKRFNDELPDQIITDPNKPKSFRQQLFEKQQAEKRENGYPLNPQLT